MKNFKETFNSWFEKLPEFIRDWISGITAMILLVAIVGLPIASVILSIEVHWVWILTLFINLPFSVAIALWVNRKW